MFWKRKEEHEETNTVAPQQRYYKVALIGSKGSGSKTSLIRKCTGSNGVPAYKELMVRGNKIILELWDSPRNKETKVDAIMIGYDITSRESYNTALDAWDSLLKRNSNAVKMVIGNKLDLASNREVSACEGDVLADFVGTTLFHEGSLFHIHPFAHTAHVHSYESTCFLSFYMLT